ncbi:MAG: hypothetical protein JOZ46_06210 [Candidatus Dormibacteraeota bacterium]|nr:hypothetical protein [Candidatus Dormibacteraeota bacterium]MBV9525392.1 hypothetical protein [Candidatus Dormibacteraeota bacterium]
MKRLLREETRKLLTTRLWWGMLLGALALASIGVIAQIATNGLRGNPLPPLTSAATQRSVFASAVSGDTFALIVGIIIVTAEFRHFTSRPTFLLEPRRGRVVAAKLLVATALGLAYGAACAVISVAIAVPWLSLKGVHVDWSSNGVLFVLLGTLLAVAIFAIVGVGVGVIIQSQVVAVSVALAYLLIVEPLLRVIPGVKEVGRFLPGAAAEALTGVQRQGIVQVQPWQGALLLLGWGLLFALAGRAITLSRDIP